MTERTTRTETQIVLTPAMIDQHVRRAKALRNEAIRTGFRHVFRWVRSRKAPVVEPATPPARSHG